MRKSVLPLSMIATLFLSGCYGASPNPMPRGYSSYDQPYKSAPGNEARDVGYDYSNAQNQAVLDALRPAASDLADKLDQHLSFSVDTVFLKMPAHTAFYNSFDHLIRDELTMRGYLLTNKLDKDPVVVEFFARDDVPYCYNNADKVEDEKNFYLGLALNVDRRHEAEHIIGDYYLVPAYDYITAGHVKFDLPVCSKAGE